MNENILNYFKELELYIYDSTKAPLPERVSDMTLEEFERYLRKLKFEK